MFGVWCVCGKTGVVVANVLLGCVSLMGCGGVETARFVFLCNDCWEVRGLMMCGITVYSGNGKGDVYFHPILWRL